MKRKLEGKDFVLLQRVKSALEDAGFGKTYGYLGRMEAILSNLCLSKTITEKDKDDAMKEFHSIHCHLYDYKNECLTIKLDELIQDLGGKQMYQVGYDTLITNKDDDPKFQSHIDNNFDNIVDAIDYFKSNAGKDPDKSYWLKTITVE